MANINCNGIFRISISGFVYLSFLLMSFICVQSRELPPLTVQTAYGSVRGVRKGNYHAFLGVPYAQPPIGELRWRNPQPLLRWDPDILEAASQPSGCIQTCTEPAFACPTITDEDCLFLNIYRPSTVVVEADGLLPVFVYIHGGNFHSGSCSALIYDGRVLTSALDAIVVCVNYRLGALGFMYLGTDQSTGEEVKGNFGLQDQKAALQFLKENIASFGGDPNKITLAGQSSGAESIAVHMTSPEASDLFQQVILFSEPFALPLKTAQDALPLGQYFASMLSCKIDTLACLRNKTAVDIQTASKDSEDFNDNPMKLFERFQVWGPVVDRQPIQKIEDGMYEKKPTMMGSVTEEGRIFAFELLRDPVPSFLYTLLISVLIPGPKSDDILKHYPADPGVQDQREIVSQLATDYVFTCPIQYVAKLMFLEKGLDVYHYIFDQAFSTPEAWDNYTDCYGHVCHGGDIPFIFGTANLAGFLYTDKEQTLVDREMMYIANFVRSGNPNIKEKATDAAVDLRYWPCIGERNGLWSSLMLSGDDGIHVVRDWMLDECSFWDDIGYYDLPKLN